MLTKSRLLQDIKETFEVIDWYLENNPEDTETIEELYGCIEDYKMLIAANFS